MHSVFWHQVGKKIFKNQELQNIIKMITKTNYKKKGAVKILPELISRSKDIRFAFYSSNRLMQNQIGLFFVMFYFQAKRKN